VPYRTYAELLRRGAGSPAVAQANRRIWTSVVEAAEPGAAAAPVVGHGDGIEPGLVACFSGADYESWGAPFGHCDGARLGLGRRKVVSVQFRRASGELRSGSQVGWGGRGRRSFRWSFLHAIPGTTGRHQADDVPDLSSNNGTQPDGSDSR